MRDRVLGVRVIGASRVLLVAEAFVLLLAVHGGPIVRPVLDGVPLAPVALVGAFGVLLLWSAIARLVAVQRRWSALAAVLADLALTAPVTVFLIALLNGATDVLALVPLYALSTAAWLLAVLQTRVRVERGHPLLPLCVAAGVGIVPWGVIALAQIALDASYGARLATPVALAGQLLIAVLLWRSFRAQRFGGVDTVAAVALIITAVAVLLGADIGDHVVM